MLVEVFSSYLSLGEENPPLTSLRERELDVLLGVHGASREAAHLRGHPAHTAGRAPHQTGEILRGKPGVRGGAGVPPGSAGPHVPVVREVGALVAAGPVAGQLRHGVVHVTVGCRGRGRGEGGHAGGGRDPRPGVAGVEEVRGGRGGGGGAVHASLIVDRLVLQDIIYQEGGGDIFLVVGCDISYVLHTIQLNFSQRERERADLRYFMLRHREGRGGRGGDGADLFQS